MNPLLIKVLIVDDSPIAAQLLSSIIRSDPGLQVMGWMQNGQQALDFLKHNTPDVITMDIVMPDMDGFEITRRIMQIQPLPIIIVSAAYTAEDIYKSFQAINAGALDILEKPKGRYDPAYPTMAANLTKAIKTAAEFKLRFKHPVTAKVSIPSHLPKPAIRVEAVAIGASLGGPQAIYTILSELPLTFPYPIFIVQHISSGFTSGFVDWLKMTTRKRIQLAVHQEIAQPGCIYVAPDNYHLEVTSENILRLVNTSPENGIRPSVGHLFRSMAHTYGSHGVGIMLTGMGHDGVGDLLFMRQKGAITIAQDQASSLMFGMPKEAIATGGAQWILSLHDIAKFLNSIN